jgi:biotin carboxylase
MSTVSTDNRVILLMPSQTYRAQAFLDAADRLGLEVVRGLDMPAPVAKLWRPTLPLDFRDPDRAARDVVAFARANPVRAIVAIDDAATVIAARACAALGLSHNAPEAAEAARNKFTMRTMLAAAGVPVPRFRLAHCDDDPAALATEIRYPVVVKPLLLSGSQGVIRADDGPQFVAAFRRTRSIVLGTGGEPGQNHSGHVLIEDYVPGEEVVLEGMLRGGVLRVLALFDKPDPLIGPFFEETIYLTPSRHSAAVQHSVAACVTSACEALGLREGPIHAEARINDGGAWIIEVAGRSIGGLCSRILRFGTGGHSLEELILRAAIRRDDTPEPRDSRAGGVMMIPIPRAGILRQVDGIDDARSVSGVEDIEITIPLKHPVVPLPEGSTYLGFIFARGDSPEYVEAALREAHRRMHFAIVPRMPLRAIRQAANPRRA